MPKDYYIRFNCNLDKETYAKLLKLQKCFTKLFNKKMTLTDTFLICLESQCEENKTAMSTIQLDYDL